MMQQIPTPRIVNEPEIARRRAAGAERQGRMMIVAVPPDLVPPVSFGSTLFQRLRIVVLSNRELDAFESSRIVGELPMLRAATGPRSASHAARPRRLQGELLCDEAGRLYEKIGNYVRPVHQLVAGPRGEVLDLTPPTAPPAAKRKDDVIDVPDHADGVEEVAAQPEQPAAAWRELTPASARPRIVRFGEFKAMLGAQLQHPERLRDSHRLPCRPRVFEAMRPQRLDGIASEVAGPAGPLLLLTPALASRLELMELAARRAPAATRRETGQILAGERAVLLTVLHDPTTPISSAPALPAEMMKTPPVLRTAIPDRFLVPWQFVCSREEALYDIDSRGGRSRIGALVRRWLGRLSSGRELRRWQALLAGKGFDDQLWTVRPPRGALSAASIQEWARRTLEAGGYDAGTMLREWEIYWTRKRA